MEFLKPIAGGQEQQVVELPIQVGVGQAQTLICVTIPLPAPALEVKDIRKKVIIDSCKVIPDKVIIDGRLRKDINFKTLLAGTVPRRPGVFTGCTGIVNTATGNVEHVTVDIAFSVFVPVMGARPGDTCVVQQAVVEGEAEEPANVTEAGTFTAIVDKSMVSLCVKVTRPQAVQMQVTPAEAACPPAVTEGVPAAGAVTTFPGTTTPGPVPGTAVGPVIIFPGPQSPGR